MDAKQQKLFDQNEQIWFIMKRNHVVTFVYFMRKLACSNLMHASMSFSFSKKESPIKKNQMIVRRMFAFAISINSPDVLNRPFK